jgi:hypothetical protein
MIKFFIIGAYIAHKIWWKRTHREITVSWEDFFKDVL